MGEETKANSSHVETSMERRPGLDIGGRNLNDLCLRGFSQVYTWFVFPDRKSRTPTRDWPLFYL